MIKISRIIQFINNMYSNTPVTLFNVSHLLTKILNPSLLIKLASNPGIEISADAKMTGITPAEFNLKGI